MDSVAETKQQDVVTCSAAEDDELQLPHHRDLLGVVTRLDVLEALTR
jgi:hypothetical protein